MKQSFKLINLPREGWVYTASAYSRDAAKIWYCLFALPFAEADHVIWETIETAIRDRFGNENKVEAAYNIKSKLVFSTMDKYLQQWETILSLDATQHFGLVVAVFTSSLPENLHRLTQSLSTVEPRDLANMVARYEASAQHLRRDDGQEYQQPSRSNRASWSLRR
ncbi:uncharacterized protein UHOD_11929 [Ustilago sp. UG-2017b]|nr:uncharacterized protein UHOD_11929 [Ustilago sp. UG-2017b]